MPYFCAQKKYSSMNLEFCHCAETYRSRLSLAEFYFFRNFESLLRSENVQKRKKRLSFLKTKNRYSSLKEERPENVACRRQFRSELKIIQRYKNPADPIFPTIFFASKERLGTEKPRGNFYARWNLSIKWWFT